MSMDELIVLRLEVARNADPITGTLSEGARAGRPFTGWLALTDAIEAVREAHGPPANGDQAAERTDSAPEMH